VGHDELKTGFFAAVLQDSYGLLCLALLVYLAWGTRAAARRAAGLVRAGLVSAAPPTTRSAE
jgi:hypothetical protein